MTASLDRLIAKYPECRDRDILRSPETLEFYLARRAEGMSHNFAALLATQRFPGTKTEALYFEGRHTLADQFRGNEAQLETVVAAARARGYEPSPYDVYEPGLADDVGDPKAFIKPSGGTTQVRQVCEAAGKSCSGLVKVRGRRSTADPDAIGPLAQDIVDGMIASEARTNPDLAAKLQEKPAGHRELSEAIREHHGFTAARRQGQFTARPPAANSERISALANEQRKTPITPRPKRKKR